GGLDRGFNSNAKQRRTKADLQGKFLLEFASGGTATDGCVLVVQLDILRAGLSSGYSLLVNQRRVVRESESREIERSWTICRTRNALPERIESHDGVEVRTRSWPGETGALTWRKGLSTGPATLDTCNDIRD